MRWTLNNKADAAKIVQLQESIGVDQPIAELLVKRNIETFEDAKAFFRPSLDSLHDPFLMKGMHEATDCILQKRNENRLIMVFGDYDVDGTTSVALMSTYLKSLGFEILSYIPDRYEEGYGVSYKGIDHAKANGIDLIIALDCGIKAIDKIKYAKDLGIDFIVCDHHRPGDNIPDAVAVLDPKQEDCNYPYDELCGCGVGFKLIQALHIKIGKPQKEIYKYLDLVATAIGSDIVPITGENRILAHFGLKLINSRRRPAFKAILEQTKKSELTITDVVFMIGPRINAAGRMKHGLLATELLCENDIEKVKTLAKDIEEFNASRKDTDRTITGEALKLIKENKEEERFTTVVYQPHWHKGVIGIVASRLTETYYRPTLVFTKSGEKLAASARSVKGFDVYDALESSAEFIEQFGGHKYAAGLTLEETNFEKFKSKFEEVVKSSIDPDLLTPEIQFDSELEFSDITPKFIRILKQFAPFGPRNMKPTFVSRNISTTGFVKALGEEGLHLKANLVQNGVVLTSIGFGLGEKKEIMDSKENFDIIYTIEENEWNGTTTVQLNLKDLKKSN
ncbi:single-stranded-DNA-specific exonuclease RecJ [Psychroflexus montanilacus]|uniref:single-stranded-DNA-specific exonuclease RecJ n=1 Tax=Psychroflexus montanilacus TaxID=2873598 RepID=UPI001CC93EE9|nr:single-stranded-DNA-specific exonuclease RecJ [Psychroflexus montanilacus]MBZ9652721.1 single-stranded-DNA-specific exonuclease RecJ [Psychroflexus montanilacus]